jgi:hypothetical protein
MTGKLIYVTKAHQCNGFWYRYVGPDLLSKYTKYQAPENCSDIVPGIAMCEPVVTLESSKDKTKVNPLKVFGSSPAIIIRRRSQH